MQDDFRHRVYTRGRFRPEMTAAVNAAFSAGNEVAKLFKTHVRSWYKEPNAPVTEADILAHELIVAELQKDFSYPILSEESADDQSRLSHDYVWIVDPIDGTRDFMEQRKDFCIMVGLVFRERPLLGVVYKPITEELYFAQVGKGAFFQKEDQSPEQIWVSQVEDLLEMRAILSRSHFSEHVLNVIRNLGIRDFRKMGSTGAKMCEIAAGRSDFYLTFTDRTNEWDTCAPEVVLHEAGGRITDYYGNQLQYNQPDVRRFYGLVASNSHQHGEVIQQIARYLPQ